jgi:trigger factor
VLPKAELGEYKGLEVGRAEPAIDEEARGSPDRELRERLGGLETVQRPAQSGDFVVLDYSGSLVGESGEPEPFPGGEGRDQLVQLGSGNLIEGFEDGLIGASAGESRTLRLTFPTDYPNPELAGRAATFEVTIKEVKLRELPEVDDDLAIDTGFDTIEELREDIRKRLREAEERRLESEFREAALDAAVEQATVQTPRALVEARAREMWERMLHSLSHRGISREAYLGISARSDGSPRRADPGRRAGAAPRGSADRGRGRRAERPERGAVAGGRDADRGARTDLTGAAAGTTSRRWAPGGAPRGSRRPPGDGADRRRRQADSDRAGAGA